MRSLGLCGRVGGRRRPPAGVGEPPCRAPARCPDSVAGHGLRRIAVRRRPRTRGPRRLADARTRPVELQLSRVWYSNGCRYSADTARCRESSGNGPAPRKSRACPGSQIQDVDRLRGRSSPGEDTAPHAGEHRIHGPWSASRYTAVRHAPVVVASSRSRNVGSTISVNCLTTGSSWPSPSPACPQRRSISAISDARSRCRHRFRFRRSQDRARSKGSSRLGHGSSRSTAQHVVTEDGRLGRRVPRTKPANYAV